MTQLNPSTTYLLQAIALIQEMQKKISLKEGRQAEDIFAEYQSALTDYMDKIGKPLSSYEKIYDGEPPSSLKMNRMLSRIEDDMNILREQANLVTAATINTHNVIVSEIEQARNLNAQAFNKLNTLQLYTTARDEGLVVFGDTFKNRDLIDDSAISSDSRADLRFPGNLTLGRDSGDGKNPLTGAKIKILPTSNGFSGNNQEVNPSSLKNKLWTDGDEEQIDYKFMSEEARNESLVSIVDNEPNTWFEYEHYQVSDADRESALNLNFVYRTDTGSNTPSTNNLVDWATGPGVKSTFSLVKENDVSVRKQSKTPTEDYGKLKLDIEFELAEVKKLNSFTLTPYGMKNNVNHPILVTKVETSSDGTTWVPVKPENVWIANRIDLSTARDASNSVLGTGVWVFEERNVKYIRARIQQDKSVSTTLGHVWWQRRIKTERVETRTPDPENPFGDDLIVVTYREVGGERVEGPIPPVTNPAKYNSIRDANRGEAVRKIEVFSGKRWSIGIRDCSVEQVRYRPESVMVSKQFKVNGVVDRIALESNIFIPDTFDPEEQWVKFFVSPNDGLNWYQISRIQDDYSGLPEIIAFNDPLPEEFHEANVAYYNVNNTVDSVRLKIELTRPGQRITEANTREAFSSTPIVKSYSLKVRKR